MILLLKCLMILSLTVVINTVINKFLAVTARSYFYNDRGITKHAYWGIFYQKRKRRYTYE